MINNFLLQLLTETKQIKGNPEISIQLIHTKNIVVIRCRWWTPTMYTSERAFSKWELQNNSQETILSMFIIDMTSVWHSISNIHDDDIPVTASTQK